MNPRLWDRSSRWYGKRSDPRKRGARSPSFRLVHAPRDPRAEAPRAEARCGTPGNEQAKDPKLYGRFGAELLERLLQLRGNVDGFAMFDIAALHHVDELSVSQNADRGRGRRIAGEVGARAIGGFGILAREHGNDLVGLGGMLQSHAHGGPHAAGCTPAN